MCVKQAQILHYAAVCIDLERTLYSSAFNGENFALMKKPRLTFVTNWKTTVTENDLKLSRVYNADETGLYWRAIANLHVKDRECKDKVTFKRLKELLICYWIISKNKKPANQLIMSSKISALLIANISVIRAK